MDEGADEPPTGEAAQVTDGLTASERLKLQSGIAKNIVESLEGNRYDGKSSTYRRWARAVLSALGSVGFDDLEATIKDDSIENLSEEEWDNYYTRDDRNFIHRVVTDTLTPTTVDIVERNDLNGVLLVRHFYKLWGSPSLANTITALTELLNIKVPKHADPSPSFKKVERIFQDFFPDSGDNMKIAVLLKILDDVKYRSVLDSLEQKDAMPSYQELKDSLLSFFYRKQAEHAAQIFERPRNLAKSGEKAFIASESKNQGTIASKRTRLCKICKQFTTDHSTFNCPHARQRNAKRQGEGPDGDRGGKASRGAGPGRNPAAGRNAKAHIRCFNCNKLGHYASECKAGPSIAKPSAGGTNSTPAVSFEEDE